MPATKPTSVTGNPFTDGLLYETQWATDRFTYSFPAQASFYGSGYGSSEPLSGFAPVGAPQQAAIRAMLADYAEIANLTFTEIAETTGQHADIRFGKSIVVTNAHAYLPGATAEAGDVWFDSWGTVYANPVQGDYAWMTIAHELGHALGLKHPHEGRAMPTAHDSIEYTVMSYRSHVGASITTGYASEDGGYPVSTMLDDVAALQHMYGANFGTRGGDTTYAWNPATGELLIDGAGQGRPAANRVFSTVWDGGGTDTYDFSAYATAVAADLRPGNWSSTGDAQLARLSFDNKLAIGNIANAYLYEGDARSLIENARGGSAGDRLTGNQADNLLEGGPGGDRLDGGAGLDVASYRHAATGVVASLGDPSRNTGDAAGDTFVSMEALEGSTHADRLQGDGGINALFGREGDDILLGGGGDTLNGGAGSDTALYTGFRTQYMVASSGGMRSVGSSWQGSDVLQDVEQVGFVDGRLVFDVADRAAVVFRMYDSMFDRTPDAVGFNYWIGEIEAGRSAKDMAQAFAGSVEFNERYGELSNGDFVGQLYRNVLNRPSEAEGLAFWTNHLDSSAADRGQVLLEFSESAEHVAMLRTAVDQGLWDLDDTAAQMARFYNAAFDRRPDADGLSYWTSAVKSGAMQASAVADLFVASQEFSTRYGSLSNTQFVDRLYHNILDRAGEADGTAFWTNALNAGVFDRGDVLAGFAASIENQHKTAADMESGILLA